MFSNYNMEYLEALQRAERFIMEANQDALVQQARKNNPEKTELIKPSGGLFKLFTRQPAPLSPLKLDI